ncbi:ankyrin repeat and EF-hand domain-containing protein 1 isoform X2 [Misgurnus anguillicaudatus]
MSRVAEGNLEVLQIYKLLQYVRAKNKSKVKKMVRIGVYNLINLTEPEQGHSALNLACVANDGDMVQFLLSLGAHPDIQDIRGCTPVMLAAQLGFNNIVALLAEHNANMNLKDEEGKGVLFYCIFPSEEHASCLQIALNFKADVNDVSDAGEPVFVFACENAKTCEDLCLSILEGGANLNAVDEVTGHTALMEASKAGAVKLVRAILQRGGNPNNRSKEGLCAAHFAADGGFLEVLMVLSAYSADLGVSTSSGNTPLHFAASGGFKACCRFLAQRGCDPKQKNLDGQLPSQIAKNRGHKAALKELKNAEQMYVKLSEPDAVNPNELWAVTLHDWSYENEATLRRALEMTEGLDKPLKNVPRETFVSLLHFHQAPVSNENLQKIITEHDENREGIINVNEFFKGLKYLQKTFVISSYAPKQSQKQGKKEKGEIKKKGALQFHVCTMQPETICRQMDSRRPACMIEKYQPFTNTRRFSHGRPPVHPIEDDSAWYIDEPEKKYINIHSCVRCGDLESLSLAFIQNLPVDVTDQFQKTPLITACSCGNYQIAKLLIALGANVNAVDQFHQTPLHHACHQGNVDMIRMLVESGATVDAVTMNGETPLMRAIKNSRLSCVEYLIKSGSNVMAKNKKEQNCLDIAKDYGCDTIIDLVSAKYCSLDKIEENKKAKQQKPKPVTKPKPAVQEKIDIQVPSPSVLAAVKLDLKENIVIKNPKFTLRRPTNKLDISFVPKNLWGKRLTNYSKHIEKKDGALFQEDDSQEPHTL